jgi:two-component system, cell cycle sensor histidine kinase PleC
VKLVDAAANAKGVTLRVEMQPNLRLLADERALTQILGNVLQNAVKFTPSGGRVLVRARNCGTNVHLFVEDSGIGIPKSALAKLGKPFEQVEHNLTRSHRGSGLGLAIARSTAELHGGSLRIRSDVGIGTIVMVRLPAPTPERLAALSRPSADVTLDTLRLVSGATPRPDGRATAAG